MIYYKTIRWFLLLLLLLLILYKVLMIYVLWLKVNKRNLACNVREQEQPVCLFAEVKQLLG